MKLRYFVIAYITTFPLALILDTKQVPIDSPIGQIAEITNMLLLCIIIVWSIVKVIKYFIRYYVEYSAEYNAEDTTMDDINAELDEIEASLDRVRASEEPDSKVTAIWSRPKKK